MTTTLLTLALLVSSAQVDLAGPRAARLNESDAPVTLAQGGRVGLLEQRATLLDEKPGFGAPIGLMAGSAGLGVLTGLLTAGFYDINGFGGLGSSNIFAAGFSIVCVIVLVAAGVVSVGMGIVGSWLLAKRIRDRDAVDAKVQAVDAELARASDRIAWPSPPPLVQAR